AGIPANMQPATGYDPASGAWDTDPATIAALTEPTTFTFTFSALLSYPVTYKIVNGTWADSTTADLTETVEHGQAPANIPTGMLPGEGFGEKPGVWSPNDPAAAGPVTGPVTFTFTFPGANDHTVTFRDGYNTDPSDIISSSVVPSGGAAAKPADPTREGYDFSGWDVTDETLANITDDLTVTAIWAVHKHNVTYQFAGDFPAAAQLPANQNDVEFGASVAAPQNPEPVEGYTFVEWKADGDGLTISAEGTYPMPDRDVTWTGTWTKNSHDISYRYDGDVPPGSEPPPAVNVPYGDPVTKPADPPAQPGYTFNGWTAPGVEPDPDGNYTMPDSPVEWVGTWTQEQYTITYVVVNGTWQGSDGATEAYQEPYFYGDTLVDLDQLVAVPNTGYNPGSGSWDETPTADTVVTGNKTYTFTYADLNVYTLTYKVVNGTWGDNTTADKTEQVAYGQNPAQVPSGMQPNTGYGEVPGLWDTDPATVTGITADQTFTFTYPSLNDYSVTFKDGYSTAPDDIIKTDTVPYGGTSTKPTDPAREGYTFTGWDTPDDALTNITSDLTVTATWQVNSYGVTFEYTGEVPFGLNPPTAINDVQYASPVAWPAAPTEPEGFTFEGWVPTPTVTVDQATGQFAMPGSDVRFSGNWKISTYNVTYKDGDGNDLTTEEVPHGGDATPPTTPPSKPGYDFGGWDNPGTNITEPIIINPIFTPKQLTVTFDANGGTTANPVSKPVLFDDLYYTLASTGRSGYTFAGWFTAASGGTQVTDTTKVTVPNDHTLYAHWTPLTNIQVNFDANGGTTASPASKAVTYGSPYGTLATTSRSGYIFNGWNTMANGSGTPVTGSTTVTTPTTHTLYAQWSPVPPTPVYTVTFTDGQGTELSRQQVPQGNNATAPTAPPRAGYTFVGWDKPYNNIQSNLTVNATWNPNRYTVTFTDGRGTVLRTQVVTHGGNATAPTTPTRTGYTFAGWDKPYRNVQGNLTVNATWQIRTYTVTYNNGQGGTISNQRVPHGSNATPPANPTRPGYVFNGWSRPPTNITGNTTITATWRPVGTTTPVIITPITTTPTTTTPTTATPPATDPAATDPAATDSGTTLPTVVTDPGVPTTDNPTTGTTQPLNPGATTVITQPDTAKDSGAGKESGKDYWSLFDLICTIIAIIAALVAIIRPLFGRDKDNRRQSDDYRDKEKEKVRKARFWAILLGIVVAVLLVILFFWTQDITLPITFFDEWSWLFFIGLILALVFMVLAVKKVKNKDRKGSQGQQSGQSQQTA
ncbi:MAG: InlB B-repeat-containing protein, partial [Actinomycetia bacterium]|nr:InlB B-repeat-containing protein [Actinomycetes bacterium]